VNQRRLWLTASGGALVAVLGVVGFVLRSAGDTGNPAGPDRITPVVASTSTPSGWNLHNGGHLNDGTVLAPQSAPDGAALPGRGQAAEVAGPGEYAGFRPALLILPSGRRAPVAPAGVRSDGTLAVPDDASKVGWWTGGALPGERYGGVVLAGHVDSQRYGIGVLAEMLRVKAGAVITVAGSRPGLQQKYRVTRVQQIPKARLAADTDAFAQDVSQRLVLITCGGPYNRETHHYRDNVVVIAQPVR
jgi:hypothetical protein